MTRPKRIHFHKRKSKNGAAEAEVVEAAVTKKKKDISVFVLCCVVVVCVNYLHIYPRSYAMQVRVCIY